MLWVNALGLSRKQRNLIATNKQVEGEIFYRCNVEANAQFLSQAGSYFR